MEVKANEIRDKEVEKQILKNGPKLNSDDSFAYTTCSYPVEIFKINDSENTITFKYLNPKEKETTKTIPISSYLDLIKKYNCLYRECSLCHNKQKKLKDNSTFSYCIKCDEIICLDCITKHLETNKKNHPNLNKDYIIKNNEKSIKCPLHPKENNLTFCFDCDTHICKECMKSKKHVMHSKSCLLEVLVTDGIKNILNGIIDIYKERIKGLNEEKEQKKEKEIELFNKKEEKIKEKQKIKKNKIEEKKKN